jgi:RNA polymerase sigma-70 factor (ECF subfamily)
MVESPDDFPILIARARLGDEEALTELFQRYEPEVRVAARVLLGRALRVQLDSMDLVQSVYHCLLVGLRQNKFDLNTPQQLLGLAMTMVRRKVAHHWRRMRHLPRSTPAPETEGVGNVLTAATTPEPGPAETAQYNDALRFLYSKLEEKDRQVVELRLQGYSTAEVARRLGLDADVLRVRLSRLRRRLRDGNLLTQWL